MTQTQKDYRRLVRLRTKRDRVTRLITVLERKLAGKKERWGSCTGKHNRH